MIFSGCVRRIDDLGRIVIPKNIRKEVNFNEGEAFEIYFDRENESVMFKKYKGEN